MLCLNGTSPLNNNVKELALKMKANYLNDLKVSELVHNSILSVQQARKSQPFPKCVETLFLISARFHLTVITQINKSMLYFIAMCNVKFGCFE